MFVKNLENANGIILVFEPEFLINDFHNLCLKWSFSSSKIKKFHGIQPSNRYLFAIYSPVLKDPIEKSRKTDDLADKLLK